MFGQVRLLIAALAIQTSACEPMRDPAPAALGSTAIAARTGARAVDGADYAVDIVDVAPPCRATASCAIQLRLVARGAYKLNAEYPMKFVPTDSPGVVHETSGPFHAVDPRTGVLEVRFTAPAPRTVTVTGTYKTAICTDEVCHINDVAIAHEIAIAAAPP